MKKLAWITGVFIFVTVINSRNSSTRHKEINPYTPVHKPYTFEGYCYCPYNLDQTGDLCGDRSAYARTGGAEPVCYVRDLR